MRVIRWAIGLMAGTVMSCGALGQDGSPATATSALKDGHLTVWVARQEPSQRGAPIASLDGVIHQQTAGSFGQTAGSYGTAASDHGQTAGSYGTAASDHGQTAGSYGQTAGSFGQTAGSYGTAASDHGQTAGSYGHSLSTIADAGALDAQAAAAKAAGKLPVPVRSSVRDPLRDRLQTSLKQSFYDLDTSFTSVPADQLDARLAAAEGTPDYPDVIVSQPLPGVLRRLAIGSGMVMFGSTGLIAQESYQPANMAAIQAVILLRAPHPDEARAYVVWLREQGGGLPPKPIKPGAEAAMGVAMGAVQDLISGQKISSPDPALAEFSSAEAAGRALEFPSTEVLDGLEFHLDVLRAAANERFAVVAMRLTASSDKAFGLVHPLVVLRKAEDGRWRVLQISANLAFDLEMRAFDRLYGYTGPVRQGQLRPVAGISQAAPVDGDNRSPDPELWWDNGGGGTLLIVEWQRRSGSSWSDSNMFFVPDNGSRLQTRVTARFADGMGAYHWRVWSVGTGGGLSISPWRTVNIGAR
jgi:hypothetical protein